MHQVCLFFLIYRSSLDCFAEYACLSHGYRKTKNLLGFEAAAGYWLIIASSFIGLAFTGITCLFRKT
jgi:hypothetical protein